MTDDASTTSHAAGAAFMRLAIEEAALAAAAGDVPVGAVAVVEGEVIGRQHNRKEALADPTAHAEILVLREVSQRLGRWRLPDVTIYCTMEPCAMCAGAMVQARLGRLVYAAPDLRAGAAGSVFDVVRSPALNHRVAVTPGVLAEEARAQLDRFFVSLRQRELPRRAPTAVSETTAVQEVGQDDETGPDARPSGTL